MKVSIIVPIYNVGDYLTKTIESCIHQTLEDLEIILVDDGSVDKSGQIADSFAAKDKRITVIHKKNEGVTVARNKGLKIAKGEYIFFLDGDDYLPSNAIELLYQKAKDHDADWVVGDFIVEYTSNKKVYKAFNDFGIADNISFLKYCFKYSDFYFTGRLIRHFFILHASINVPKEITFGEDNVAVVQLAYQVHRAVKINIPVLYYVQRSTSVTNKLEKRDLVQRGNALSFIQDYIVRNKLYTLIKDEYALFLINESITGLIRGYIDNRLLSLLRSLPIEQYRNNISMKSYFSIKLLLISPSFAIWIYGFLKQIKNIFK